MVSPSPVLPWNSAVPLCPAAERPVPCPLGNAVPGVLGDILGQFRRDCGDDRRAANPRPAPTTAPATPMTADSPSTWEMILRRVRRADRLERAELPYPPGPPPRRGPADHGEGRCQHQDGQPLAQIVGQLGGGGYRSGHLAGQAVLSGHGGKGGGAGTLAARRTWQVGEIVVDSLSRRLSGGRMVSRGPGPALAGCRRL